MQTVSSSDRIMLIIFSSCPGRRGVRKEWQVSFLFLICFGTFESFNSICLSNFPFAGTWDCSIKLVHSTRSFQRLENCAWVEDSGKQKQLAEALASSLVLSRPWLPKLARNSPGGPFHYCKIFLDRKHPIGWLLILPCMLLQPKTVTLVAFWHFAKSSSTFKFKCSAPQIYSLPISSNPSNLQYSSKYKMHFLPKDLRRVLPRVVQQILHTYCKIEKVQVHLECLLEDEYKSIMLMLVGWIKIQVTSLLQPNIHQISISLQATSIKCYFSYQNIVN